MLAQVPVPPACRMRAALSALALPAMVAQSQNADIAKLVLDEQQRNYTGTPFSAERWEGFLECMDAATESAGFSVRGVTEAGWSGFLEYARSNGSEHDPWNPPGYAPLPNGTRTGGWYEYNPQPMAHDNRYIPGATSILITEPCNYNSNVAYYSSMTTMCNHHLHADWVMPRRTVDLVVASFSTLASGSSFLHSSGTALGGTMDTTPIGHISLAAYQAAVSALPENSFIANARPNATETGHNGTDEIAALCGIMVNSSVYSWNSRIIERQQQYQSDYYITFGAIVVLGARLGVAKEVADTLLPIAADAFGLSPQDTAFLLEDFDPAMQRSLAEAAVEVPEADKITLIQRSIGMLLKMFYAFFWQEGIFKGDWLASENANNIGGDLIPLVNALGDLLTGYVHPEYVRKSIQVYAGNDDCKHLVAHAKWHEQSANALVDLIFLTDDMHRLVLGKPLNMAGNDDVAHAQARESFVHGAATRGCFDAFSQPENLADVAQELRAGPVACLKAGSEYYDESKGIDTRIRCLSTWALGSADDTMDSCLVHNDCLAPGTGGSRLSFSSVQACAATACSHLIPAETIRRLALAACIDACPISTATEPEFLCAAQCLAQHTPFSKIGTALLQCGAPGVDAEEDVTLDWLVQRVSCVADSAKFQPKPKFWELLADSARCLRS